MPWTHWNASSRAPSISAGSMLLQRSEASFHTISHRLPVLLHTVAGRFGKALLSWSLQFGSSTALSDCFKMTYRTVWGTHGRTHDLRVVIRQGEDDRIHRGRSSLAWIFQSFFQEQPTELLGQAGEKVRTQMPEYVLRIANSSSQTRKL